MDHVYPSSPLSHGRGGLGPPRRHPWPGPGTAEQGGPCPCPVPPGSAQRLRVSSHCFAFAYGRCLRGLGLYRSLVVQYLVMLLHYCVYGTSLSTHELLMRFFSTKVAEIELPSCASFILLPIFFFCVLSGLDNCPGFWNRWTIRFMLGSGASADSLRMMSYMGLEGGSETRGLYWFRPKT